MASDYIFYMERPLSYAQKFMRTESKESPPVRGVGRRARSRDWRKAVLNVAPPIPDARPLTEFISQLYMPKM
jgi:hypothetical protein